MRLGVEGAWLAACLCVVCASGGGEADLVPHGRTNNVIKTGSLPVLQEIQDPPPDRGTPEDANDPPTGDDGQDGGEDVDNNGGESDYPNEQIVNVVVNNVALISWLQASESYDPAKKHLTVGALIATNAIVCAPSGKVPVTTHNTSNWIVHQVAIANPHAIVEGKGVIVVYHPEFSMDKDSTSRIALIMLLPESERATQAMTPIKMVAAPFLPLVETTRHDDYSLSSCIMVVANKNGDGIVHVEMSAIMCRHNKKAKKHFRDRICAYTKMKESKAEVMGRSLAYPRDQGSPLICGNLLVGMYAGIQNIRGTYHKEAGPDADNKIFIGGKRLSNEEQYVFDIPGAPKNFEFLSAFVNEEKRKMRWEQKLNLRDTNECLVKEIRPNLGASGPVDGGDEISQPEGGSDDGDEPGPAPGGEEAAGQDSPPDTGEGAPPEEPAPL